MGLALLRNTHVAIFGLGGVGSACAEALVRGGVGHFLFIDKDAVEPSNINRQAVAWRTTIGKRKVDVMRAMAAEINPQAKVLTLDAFVRRENIDELMEGVLSGVLSGANSSKNAARMEATAHTEAPARLPKPDFIVDALDTLTAKLAVIQYAQAHDIPVISAMGGANKTDPTQLIFVDLFDTRTCPMCREMRKIARDAGVTQLQVLYSPEPPVKVAAQDGAARLEKTELGTMSYFPPIMGEMIAGWVIKHALSQ